MGWIIAACIVAAVAIALGVMWGIARIRYRRSFAATLCEWYLRLTEKRKNTEQAEAEMPVLAAVNDVPFVLPRMRFASEVAELEICGVQTFAFAASEQKAILYLHGSGYVHLPRKQHLRFADRLARATGAVVLMPMYPKAPHHGWQDCHKAMHAVYAHVRAQYTDLTLMGDSAGGGLALALCEELLVTKTCPQPDRMVLLTPWVDLALKNSLIPQFEPTDPIETVAAARVWAKHFAKGTALTDFHLSPIHGDMMGLAPIYLTVGTRELLYPDVKLLALILRDSRVQTELEIGAGLNHVYPIFPIPEARRTQARIAAWINGSAAE